MALWYWTTRHEGRRLPLRSDGHHAPASYHGGLIKVRPECLDQYLQLHDRTWEQVLSRMYESNIRDFTIWFHDETNLLFSQFVYVGDDFDADMANIAADPIVRWWWSFCEPCQEPFHWSGPPPSQGGGGDPARPGEWWAPLRLATHCGAWATAWAKAWPNPDFERNRPELPLTSKDAPPPLHNRPSWWTSYTQLQ